MADNEQSEQRSVEDLQAEIKTLYQRIYYLEWQNDYARTGLNKILHALGITEPVNEAFWNVAIREIDKLKSQAKS